MPLQKILKMRFPIQISSLTVFLLCMALVASGQKRSAKPTARPVTYTVCDLDTFPFEHPYPGLYVCRQDTTTFGLVFAMDVRDINAWREFRTGENAHIYFPTAKDVIDVENWLQKNHSKITELAAPGKLPVFGTPSHLPHYFRQYFFYQNCRGERCAQVRMIYGFDDILLQDQEDMEIPSISDYDYYEAEDSICDLMVNLDKPDRFCFQTSGPTAYFVNPKANWKMYFMKEMFYGERVPPHSPRQRPIPYTEFEMDTFSCVGYAGLYLCRRDTLPHFGRVYVANVKTIFHPYDKSINPLENVYTPAKQDVVETEKLLSKCYPKLASLAKPIPFPIFGSPDKIPDYLRDYLFYKNKKGERCVFLYLKYAGDPYSIQWRREEEKKLRESNVTSLGYIPGGGFDGNDTFCYLAFNLDKRRCCYFQTNGPRLSISYKKYKKALKDRKRLEIEAGGEL